MGYYLFAHAQFMPLRDGLYACEDMSVENEDGAWQWPVANDDLLLNPVGSPDGDDWIEDLALVNGKTVLLVQGEDEKPYAISNRIVNIPFLGSGVPQAGYTYFRSYGISDFLILDVVLANPDDQFSEVQSLLIAKCNKGWAA